MATAQKNENAYVLEGSTRCMQRRAKVQTWKVTDLCRAARQSTVNHVDKLDGDQDAKNPLEEKQVNTVNKIKHINRHKQLSLPALAEELPCNKNQSQRSRGERGVGGGGV